MNYKDYRSNILLKAPEQHESENCRERIFNLIHEMNKAKITALDETQNQNLRDAAIHNIKYLANRLLWETNG